MSSIKADVPALSADFYSQSGPLTEPKDLILFSIITILHGGRIRISLSHRRVQLIPLENTTSNRRCPHHLQASGPPLHKKGNNDRYSGFFVSPFRRTN